MALAVGHLYHVDGGGLHHLVMRARIEHHKAARSREPQASIAGAMRAPADRITGSALGAPKTVLNAIINGLQPLPASLREFLELPLVDPADAARRAQP